MIPRILFNCIDKRKLVQDNIARKKKKCNNVQDNFAQIRNKK